MNAYSKDLRLKILEALDRGIPRTEAVRTFGVSIATIERYVRRRRRGEDLAPRSSPGRTPIIGSSVQEQRALSGSSSKRMMLALLSVTASCGRGLRERGYRSRR
jgi:transposase